MTEMKPTSGFGGDVIYRPRVDLTEAQRDNLAAKFLLVTEAEGAENGSVEVDWLCNNADGPPYTTREGVLLYRDGGDWEDARFVFYRTSGAIHAPTLEQQTLIGAAVLWMWLSATSIANAMSFLDAYLGEILNDPAAWQPFDINTYPETDHVGPNDGDPFP